MPTVQTVGTARTRQHRVPTVPTRCEDSPAPHAHSPTRREDLPAPHARSPAQREDSPAPLANTA
ncbi:hypothetical protein JZ785_24950 [Alicyclobacillus curvatus]|nr:hypothetical protein JZ785_24950 [Alicyclobacillus curvatus]